MKISKKSQYGLRAMVELALYHKKGPRSAKAVSAKQAIPLQYLEQIFNQLKRRGLIKTIRGPRGGYMLSIDPYRVKVKDIMEALGDNYSLIDCLDTKPKVPCDRSDTCTTKNFWKKLDNSVKKVLTSTNLKDLCPDPPKDKGANIGHKHPFQI